MSFSEHEFWFCLFVYTEWLRVALGHSSELEGKVRVHQVLGLVRQKKPDDDNERNSKATTRETAKPPEAVRHPRAGPLPQAAGLGIPRPLPGERGLPSSTPRPGSYLLVIGVD